MTRGFLSAFRLKAIMAVLMLLDHIYYYIPGMPAWFTYAGRLVAPVFTFLMAESFFYTSNRVRYIRRLLWAGLAMYGGNVILTLIFKSPLRQDILLSLAVSAGMLYYCERLRLKTGGTLRNVCVLALLVGAACFCEGMFICPAMALVFFYTRGRPALMSALYVCVMTPLVYVLMGGRLFPQILMLFALLPIFAYNGQRGCNNAPAKYFFYVFYPLHIWILYVLGCAVFSG